MDTRQPKFDTSPEGDPFIDEQALGELCGFILGDVELKKIFLNVFDEDSLNAKLRNIIERQMKDLELFGLELSGKRSLNIGANMPIFDKYLSLANKDVDAVAMDSISEDENLKLHSPYVIAVSTELPFPNNSFDLIISHAAIPHSYAQKYDDEELTDFLSGIPDSDFRRIAIRTSLEEALRVLKPGGQIRLSTLTESEDPYQNARYKIVKTEFEKFAAKHPVTETSYNDAGLIIIKKPKDYSV